MLYFIIPLRSAKTSQNWSSVQVCLERTLASCDNQTSREFRILLVCHEPPDAINIPESCELVSAPFPAPEVSPITRNVEESLFKMHSDKGRKQLLGLTIAQQRNADFVMFLDADDWVSQQLAKLTLDHMESNGWYFEGGYRWNIDTPGLLFERNKFYEECGSSHIIRTSIAPYPRYLDLKKDMDDYFIRRFVVHAYVKDALEKLGYPLEALPFPGAIYTFNGQNIYANSFRRPDSWLRTKARMLLKGKRFTPEIQQEFGVSHWITATTSRKTHQSPRQLPTR